MTRFAAWTLLRSGSPAPEKGVRMLADERDFDARDRGLLRRLVTTEVRRRGTLRAMVRQFARGKPSADMAAILHVGLVQLFFLDKIPNHAAVSETVRASADALGLSKGKYVNAVLRSALRARREGSSGDPQRDIPGRPWHLTEPFLRDPEEHPYLWAEDALNIPARLMKRWVKRHGEDAARALALTFLDEGPLSIRCRMDRDEFLARHEGLEVGRHDRIALAPTASTEEILASEEFAAGRITVQGETALRAAEWLQAEGDERLLDLCAAPGGKTAVLAESGAEVVACDIGKLDRIGETLKRLNLLGNVEICESNGTATLEPGFFDGVLVDAPCSNTGVLGARPSARWRYGPETSRSLRDLQARLLHEGSERVRPGGRIVYSTCSLEPEENGQQVRAFLEAHPDFELEEDFEALPSSGAAGPIDGGYAARLRRALL